METTSQSLCDNFLSQATQLSEHTVTLARQVESLQVEADAFKAHGRDLTAKNKLLQAENESFTTHTLVLIIIDGDGALFDEALLKQGREGGKMAAIKLRQIAVEQASMRLGKSDGSLQVMAHVFLNKLGLANTFEEHQIVDQKRFDHFCLGFNQASPLFNLTDVGSGKEAADAKIKDTLRLFAAFPQTGLVLLGGAAHDAGYTPMLSALKTDGLIHKIVLLKAYSDMAFEIYKLDVPFIEPDGLFIKKKLVNIPPWRSVQNGSKKLSPPKSIDQPASSASSPFKHFGQGTSKFPPPPSSESSVTSSNASESRPPTAPKAMIPHTGTPDTFGGNSKNSKFRTIPCWRFHLEGNCQFGLKCTFSHEPITPEQKEDLYKRFAHQTTRTSKSNEGDGTPVKASSSQEPPQTPFTPKASSKPSRINKSDFDTLIDVVNYHSHGTPNNAPLPRAALKSQVGADNRVQLAWRGRNLGSFREYVAAAEQLKLVQSWRPAGPGSDLIGVVKSKHARQQSGGILNLGALDLNPVWDSASEQEDEVVMEFE